ncbi:MAG TPA: hypoxanthine phosphoribosyltransferase [Aggregatilineales bacterium]|nr:hypoxanthine phosphoribosyltransferase [Aggregatilineales bacterium]
MIDEITLQTRIKELGTQISDSYRNRGELLLICILKGGVMFLTDLMRHIDIPHEVEFMAVSSYGSGGRESSGHVRILMDLATDIQNKHVLIVEDIIDSGHTLAYLSPQLKARHPASLAICTLLSKPSRREVDVLVEYLGFEIPNEFVFGYGLDLDEKFRNLPFIGVVDLNVYDPKV